MKRRRKFFITTAPGLYLALALAAGVGAQPVWAQDPGQAPLPEDISGPLEQQPSEPTSEPKPPSEETRPAETAQENHGEPQRASSGSGEKVFDWSKYNGASEIAHPFAEKGLIRITQDRTYIYKIPKSEQHHAAMFHVGMFAPNNLANPDTGSTFADNYNQSSNPAFLFELEWQLWKMPTGKIGIQAGFGASVAQGHGHFANNYPQYAQTQYPGQTLAPIETLTFIMLPLNFGPVYRLQFWDVQLLAPYVSGGASLFGFTEIPGNKAPKFGGAVDVYFAGGLAINLSYFDALSRIQLEREYGIHSIYLTAEYRQIVAITERFDFSGDLLNAGFLMEY